ncbi:MAG: M1 family aminopeptidase [Bacteroidota bacterium]
MFTTIFKYELQHWLRHVPIYIYAFIFLGMSVLVFGGMASESTARWDGLHMNSAFQVFKMANLFNVFIYFLLPGIIGLSIYRDFRDNRHALLYAFPFKKMEYLSAKFCSAFLMTTAIVLMIGTGFISGTMLPDVNTDLLGPLRWTTYLQLYALFLIPNTLFVSLLIFAVVARTRNIFAGFVVVVLLVIGQVILGVIDGGTNFTKLAAVLDPLALKAIGQEVEYWTIAEKNNQLLPITGLVLFNRLFWLGGSLLLAIFIYQSFEFSHLQSSISRRAFKAQTGKQTNTNLPSIPFNYIQKIQLPKVQFNFSLQERLKATWRLSSFDFQHIVKSWLFLSLVLAGLVFIGFMLGISNPRWDTKTYPVTWQMLFLPDMYFSGVINLITFLYAGVLVHRARMNSSSQIIDSTAIPSWVLLLSKFLALIKVQVVLLALMMLGGMAVQAFQGYYKFEIGHYLFELYGIHLIHFVIWAMLALFVHSLLRNPYLGFFLLLFAPMGFIALGPTAYDIGWEFLEHPIFRYNQESGPITGVPYSDMDAYGAFLPIYFTYKIYWLTAGGLLLMGAFLFWQRGLTYSFGERLARVRQRFNWKLQALAALLLIAFLSMGFKIYYESNIKRDYYSDNTRDNLLRAAKKEYKAYEKLVQPRITDVEIVLDLFPGERRFEAKGGYWLQNKSNQAIDTLMIVHAIGLHTNYQFDRAYRVLNQSKVADVTVVDLILLEESLKVGDSLKMNFKNYNDAPTLLHADTYVKAHGTLIRDDIFPRLGNWIPYFSDGHHHTTYEPNKYDTTSIDKSKSFVSIDSDRINFSATVSTNKDQIALASGNLQKQWTENDRNYFQFKSERKMPHAFIFTSGEYAIRKDQWKDVTLEIYYHKEHDYNLDRMMSGMKAALDYCSEYFSPYHYKELRIVEFSQTGGASAHSYPNTIPTGEGAGFIAMIDDREAGGVDYAFGTAVHEVAHQWWGGQVIPADAPGAKMIVESLAEYVNLQVKKHHKGKAKMLNFVRYAQEDYLKGRSRKQHQEHPLMYTRPDQNYIHYPKGALAFYALSEHLGEEQLNTVLEKYVRKVAFQENDYTTSSELVNLLRAATPDSLQYLIEDWFETITFYDNEMLSVETQKQASGSYETSITFNVQKYRSDGDGNKNYANVQGDSLHHQKLSSLPLKDYVEISMMDEEEKLLQSKKYLIQQIHNQVLIRTDFKPTKVVIDPNYLLMDREREDNFLEKI